MDSTAPDPIRMPAEWSPHDRTLVAWPQREEAWRGTTIEEARDTHATVIEAISQFEPVLVLADPSQAEDARRRVPDDDVEVLAVPVDDSWIRDSGPIVVTYEGGRRAGIDFSFNAWGMAFEPYDNDNAVSATVLDHLGIERLNEDMILEGGSIAVDGEGLLVTTEQCLLAPTRNPDMDRGGIEAVLRGALGADRIVWLGQGLLEDADTDGHVDNICAFIEPGRALLQTVEEGDPNWENTRENVRRLAEADIETVEFELLPRIEREDGESVVVPYMNFYIANGALIVPIGGVDPDMDDEALGRLSDLYPGHEVVGVDARVLALGGGGIHCITQQIPAEA
ncbi:MAG: agmatine deiminase family protein [Solirubrobacterales bacterium]